MGLGKMFVMVASYVKARSLDMERRWIEEVDDRDAPA
jgi:hypothetical protein